VKKGCNLPLFAMTTLRALSVFVLFACIAFVNGGKARTRYNYPQYDEESVPQMAGSNLYDYLEKGSQDQPRFREDESADPNAAAPAAPAAAAAPAAPLAAVLPPEPSAASAPTLKAPIIIGAAAQKTGPQPVRVPPKSQQDAVQAQQAEQADPEMVKLDSALEAVKEDIMANSKKIADEKKWVKAVTKITASYEEKVKRVEEHIIVLRKEQKKLFTKKKQLENLKLQRRLESKLRDANDELAALQNSLKNVQLKNEQLNKSHMDLRATIINIENQLAKLKGEDAKMKEGEGQEVKSEVQAKLEGEGLEVDDGDQGAAAGGDNSP